MTQASIRLQAGNQPNKYLTSFVSGGVAGILSKSLVAPFDRVKILFQTSTKKFTYQSAIHEGLHICKNEGFWALWKGNGATAVRVFPYAAAQFVAFDFFQAAMMNSDVTNVQRNVINFICGSLAGLCATSLTYPAELVRTRMAVEKNIKIGRSMTKTTQYIYRKEGFRAFYQGMYPSLIGIIPCHGSGFLIFHYMRNKMQEEYPDWRPSKLSDFTFGAIAGFSAQFISCPLDVIRKKMQVQHLLHKRGEIEKLMGISHWGKHIVKTEGFQGLFKGFTMHFLKAPVASGTCFLFKNILHKTIDPSFKP